MLGDIRLLTRSYGRIFLDSLPRMPRTRKLEVVQRFFDRERSFDPPPASSAAPDSVPDPADPPSEPPPP
ncbi:MAG: hypothetical protein R3E89_00140 [Thiolinea sp.]